MLSSVQIVITIFLSFVNINYSSLITSSRLFLTSVFSLSLLCQLWGSQSGDAVSPGDRPVSRVTADAVGAARARLPARFSRQLLAEPAGAV